ncbi:hypothetical protein TRFO_20525 [Tritrichomonas foetus]|uniref:E2F/DP family winged-helix DNA-binding domain-containing protein n=1 Tax=Tritrichomonas foetus TaxID=1144522 RepID=A0A1J4KG87_9EUKA|nr:hypothetical protein TRFO_20525 [Tritrichomonas foetus]|eukprot:OHT10227.1 hypothetical protein TRFO_20525 [Tritrichomonas foetus]
MMLQEEISIPCPINGFQISPAPHQKLAEIFEVIKNDLENGRITNCSIMHISQTYFVQHRRVYDFFSLMTALGACKCISSGRFQWEGLDKIKETIKEYYASFEVESLNKSSIKVLFGFGKSPSLGRLAKNFICLFLFLGVKHLQMQKVVKLLHDRKSDVKSIERRMYIVLKFLTVIGLIDHTNNPSEYEILFDPTEIIEYGILKRRACLEGNFVISIETLLNGVDQSFLKNLYFQRALEFKKVF